MCRLSSLEVLTALFVGTSRRMITKENKQKRASGASPQAKQRARKRHKALPVLIAALFLVAIAAVLRSRNSTRHVAPAKSSRAQPSFAPTIANTAPAPASAPEGMVWIPGGEFSMGANDPPDMNEVGMQATADARPIHRVYVDGFFMDKTE